jgi:hypothetical protein
MSHFREMPNNYKDYIKDDPVRPELDYEFRTSFGKQIFQIDNSCAPLAICCVAYLDQIPTIVEELNAFPEFADPPRIAVFYTVWSYEKGYGRQIIFDIVKYIQKNKPHIKRFVTLSPKTEMARRFHLSNGAVLLKENEKTINYEYIIR